MPQEQPKKWHFSFRQLSSSHSLFDSNQLLTVCYLPGYIHLHPLSPVLIFISALPVKMLAGIASSLFLNSGRAMRHGSFSFRPLQQRAHHNEQVTQSFCFPSTQKSCVYTVGLRNEHRVLDPLSSEGQPTPNQREQTRGSQRQGFGEGDWMKAIKSTNFHLENKGRSSRRDAVVNKPD